MAISDLEGRGLAQDQAQIISDRLRNEVVSIGKVRLMERSLMQSLLKEQGFTQSGACDNSECQVQLGRMLGVDHLVVGSIGLLGSLYTINVRILSVESGEIVKSFNLDKKGDIEDLIGKPLQGLAQQISNSLAPSEPKTNLVPKVNTDNASAQTSTVASTPDPNEVAIDLVATPSSDSIASIPDSSSVIPQSEQVQAPKQKRTWRFWTRIGLGVAAGTLSAVAILKNRDISYRNTDIANYTQAYVSSTTSESIAANRLAIEDAHEQALTAKNQRNASALLATLCAAGIALTFAF